MAGKTRWLTAIAVIGLTAAAVKADPINIYGDTANSTSNLGDFTGTLNYVVTDSGHAQLIVSLTNTSPAANGGFLTAFVFNNPGDLITGVSLTDPAFKATLANDAINGSPFGQFDIAASIAGNPKSSFTDGGNPSSGIGVGQSDTFTFDLTGSNLDSLTTASFLAELSGGPGDGSGDEWFVARFRGFLNGGSDKVPGTTGGGGGGGGNNGGGGGTPPPGGGGDPNGGGNPNDPPPPVPEPASMVLWAAIGLGVLSFNRSRSKLIRR
jgi:hypothetical protein